MANFINAVEGLAEQREEVWNQVRTLGYWTLAPTLTSRSGIRGPRDLIQLPSDGEYLLSLPVSKVYKLTPEEIEQWHKGTWKPY